MTRWSAERPPNVDGHVWGLLVELPIWERVAERVLTMASAQLPRAEFAARLERELCRLAQEVAVWHTEQRDAAVARVVWQEPFA